MRGRGFEGLFLEVVDSEGNIGEISTVLSFYGRVVPQLEGLKQEWMAMWGKPTASAAKIVVRTSAVAHSHPSWCDSKSVDL